MADEHPENTTPDATDDDVSRIDEDNTAQGDARPGASADEGAGASPDPSDAQHTDDPKGSQRPV